MGWRGRNHLQRNTGKTKELVVDFQHKMSQREINIRNIFSSNTSQNYGKDDKKVCSLPVMASSGKILQLEILQNESILFELFILSSTDNQIIMRVIDGNPEIQTLSQNTGGVLE